MLELYLQHGVDKPVDYDPIDRLVGIYNDIVDKKLLSITEYAKSVNFQYFYACSEIYTNGKI